MISRWLVGLFIASAVAAPIGPVQYPAINGVTGVLSYAPTTGAFSQGTCGGLSGAAASCGTDTTNAANISSGTLAAARGGAGSVNGALKGNGSGAVSQAACGDLSNAAASCSTDATNAGNIGAGTLPAARLPAPTGSTLGGIESVTCAAHQWINAISGAGAPSCAQPAAADVSGLAASATTDTTNASNIGSGTLAAARGGAGTVNGALKGNGSGAVSQAACADLSDGATGCSTPTGTSGATLGKLNTANVYSAQQSGSVTTLSISTATFTPDLSNNHYKITLIHASCPCTIANPSGTPTAGTTGLIEIVQSSSGTDTIGTWGSSYLAPGGTATIILSTGANAKDGLGYYVEDSTHIWLFPSFNFAH